MALNLKLDAQPPINGLNMHKVKTPFDTLGNFLIKGNQGNEDQYLHVHDDFTLVFANKPLMEKFLQDNAKPKQLSQPPADPNAKPTDPNAKPDPNAPPAGGGRSMLPKPAYREMLADAGEREPEYQFVSFQGKQRPPPNPGRNPIPNPGRNPGVNPGFNPNPIVVPAPVPVPAPTPPPAPVPIPTIAAPVPGMSYLTVDPALKSVLDKVEVPNKPSLVVVGTFGRSHLAAEIGERAIGALLSGQRAQDPILSGFTDKFLKSKAEPFHDVKVMACSVTALSESKLGGVVALEGSAKLEETAQFFTGVLPEALKKTLDLEVSGVSTQPAANGNAGRDGGLSLNKADQTIVFAGEVALKEPAFNYLAYKLSEFIVQLKSRSQAADARSHVHELAAALQAYVKAKNAFPRGTAALTGDNALGNPPNTRVSWMAELLPYVGDGSFNVPVDPNLRWTEGSNFLAAQMVVPQFLARTTTDQPVQIHYPAIATPWPPRISSAWPASATTPPSIAPTKKTQPKQRTAASSATTASRNLPTSRTASTRRSC